MRPFLCGVGRWAAVLVFLAMTPWAVGQEEKLALEPPLSQVFPLAQGPNEVRLAFPVLLNERTILKPNAILRFIYIDPDIGPHGHGGGAGDSETTGGGGGGHGHHHGPDTSELDDASSRPSLSDRQALFPDPESKRTKTELQSEVWTQADLFRDALDAAADLGTTVVYSFPGKQKPQTAAFDLPDGMLLGEKGGHVEVLGLAPDSTAGASGLRAEDQIRSMQGTEAVNSLDDFLRVYFPVREAARKSNQSYTMEVWRPSEARMVTIEVAAPPSLNPLF